MERRMNWETIEKNEEKIRKQVLTNKEFYKKGLANKDIETDDDLVAEVENEIFWETEIADYFDWLWWDEHYVSDEEEYSTKRYDSGWANDGNYYSNRYPNGFQELSMRYWMTYIQRHEEAEQKRFREESARQERLKSFKERER